MENNTPYNDPKPADKAVSRVMSTLKHDMLVIGKHHVHTWHGLLVVGLVAGLMTGVALVANRSGEIEGGDAATQLLATATITIDTTKVIKPVNRNLLGTSISTVDNLPAGYLQNPRLKKYLNVLKPTVITIQNTSLGFPFYPETTGPRESRMSYIAMLDRMDVTSDPAGQKLYDNFKDRPEVRRPPEQNYEDILQYLESLAVPPRIILRIPTIFTSIGGDYVSLRLNLDPKTGSDLVHYLNDPETTELGRLRTRNGHPKPYNVKYFVLGNEMWNNVKVGLTVEQIASQHIAFVKAMRAADPTIKIGFNLVHDAFPRDMLKPEIVSQNQGLLNFNTEILSQIKNYVDFIAYHDYNDFGLPAGGKELATLNDAEWKNVLSQVFLRQQYDSFRRLANIVNPYNKNANIVIDEYSGPVATLGGAVYEADFLAYLIANDYEYATNWSLGLVEADTYFGLIKFPNDPSLSSGYIRRPVFYVHDLFTNHFGDQLLAATIESPTFETKKARGDNYDWPAVKNIPSLHAIASEKDGKLYAIVINRSTDTDITAKIILAGKTQAKAKKVTIYTVGGSSINATSEKRPDTIATIQSEGKTALPLIHTFKKHSVVALEIEMEEGQNVSSEATCVFPKSWSYVSDQPLRTPSGANLSPWNIVADPTVIYDQDKFRMWYTAADGRANADGSGNGGIAYATSKDGLVWDVWRKNDSPKEFIDLVLTGSRGGWDEPGVETASVMRTPSGEYRMYYSGNRPPEGSIHYAIGLATSKDGIRWKKYGNSPVFEPKNSWELPTCSQTNDPRSCSNGGVLEPSVIYDSKEKIYKMWYAALGTKDDFLTFRMGYATSADGISWNRRSEPVLERGKSDSWNDYLVSHVNVVPDPRFGYHLFYVGAKISEYCEGCAQQRAYIGHAYSTDGIQWQQDPQNPILSPGHYSWDKWTIGGPSVIAKDNELLLWFFANIKRDSIEGNLAFAKAACQ